jgi:hypothetical protein
MTAGLTSKFRVALIVESLHDVMLILVQGYSLLARPLCHTDITAPEPREPAWHWEVRDWETWYGSQSTEAKYEEASSGIGVRELIAQCHRRIFAEKLKPLGTTFVRENVSSPTTTLASSFEPPPRRFSNDGSDDAENCVGRCRR